jgi:hypothetical protein
MPGHTEARNTHRTNWPHSQRPSLSPQDVAVCLRNIILMPLQVLLVSFVAEVVTASWEFTNTRPSRRSKSYLYGTYTRLNGYRMAVYFF